MKKKTKNLEKKEDEKIMDKSFLICLFSFFHKLFIETINLICRQGNKVFAKEISLPNDNKIASILSKKEELEAVKKFIIKKVHEGFF